MSSNDNIDADVVNVFKNLEEEEDHKRPIPDSESEREEEEEREESDSEEDESGEADKEEQPEEVDEEQPKRRARKQKKRKEDSDDEDEEEEEEEEEKPKKKKKEKDDEDSVPFKVDEQVLNRIFVADECMDKFKRLIEPAYEKLVKEHERAVQLPEYREEMENVERHPPSKRELSYHEKESILRNIFIDLDLFTSPPQDMNVFQVYFNNEVLEHLYAYILEHSQPKDQDRARLGVEAYIRDKSKTTFLNLYQCAYTYVELMNKGEIDTLNKAFYRWYSVRAKLDTLIQQGDKEVLVDYVNKERKNKYIQHLMDIYVKKNILFQKSHPHLKMEVMETYDWVMSTNLEKSKHEYQRIEIPSKERPERLFKVAKPKKSKKPKQVELTFTIEPKPYFHIDEEDMFNVSKLRSYLVRCKTPKIDQRGGIRIQRDIELDNQDDLVQVGALLDYIFPLYAKLTSMEVKNRGRSVTVQQVMQILDRNIAFYTEGELKRIMDHILGGQENDLKRKVRDLQQRAMGICINELFPGLLKDEILELFPDENSSILSDLFPDVFSVKESRPLDLDAGKRAWIKGRIEKGKEMGGYYEIGSGEKAKERTEDEKRRDAEKQRSQWAKLKEHMKQLPVQDEPSRLFLSGRLRREDRKKRVRAFYEEKKPREHELQPVLSNDCISKTEGVFVRRMDDHIPERRLVHTNQYQYSKEQHPYYVPTPLMKQKICATQEIHDDAIDIEGVLYACATRDEKYHTIVPYNKFQYDQLRALQTVSRDNVFVHLVEAQNASTKRLFQRIYAKMEKDVGIEEVFIPLYELVKSVADQLSIHQVLLIFYMFVVFHNPSFQLYHKDVYSHIRARYESKAFHNELVNLVKKGHVNVQHLLSILGKVDMPIVEDYIEKFIHQQLVQSFPYIQFEHVPFPYLPSMITMNMILGQFKKARDENADKLGVKKHACSFCKKKKVVLRTLGLPKLKEMWVCENCVDFVVNK